MENQKSKKFVIIAVDHGFEHGPERSFLQNPNAYDPMYHYRFAKKAYNNKPCTALVAPLGFLQTIADTKEYQDDLTNNQQVSFILKLNSNNLFNSNDEPDQCISGTVEDAIRLRCDAVGFTIYPGSKNFNKMAEELRKVVSKVHDPEIIAKNNGKRLLVMVWAYPRGSNLSNFNQNGYGGNSITTKEAESAFDVISYSVHLAALLGADIIKAKIPNIFVTKDNNDIMRIYDKKTDILMKNQTTLESKMTISDAMMGYEKTLHETMTIDESSRNNLLLQPHLMHNSSIRGIIKSAFNGRKVVLFSGGEHRDEMSFLKDVVSVAFSGGEGLVIGRNLFHRTEDEASNLFYKTVHAMHLNVDESIQQAIGTMEDLYKRVTSIN